MNIIEKKLKNKNFLLQAVIIFLNICISSPFYGNWLVMEDKSKQTINTRNPINIRKMFDSIAPTYDLLNHLMSLGLDIRWRKKAVACLPFKKNGTILDIATGSGDVAFEILKYNPYRIVAADFSINMLDVLREKIHSPIHPDSITFTCCDAQSLPFQNNVFDATLVAFGIRNFPDRLVSLREMFRVLKPNGISIILELTKPKGLIISQIYSFYSRSILPVLGKIISRHKSAYSYLPESITIFPDNEEFLSMMEQAGFTDTNATLLTFGTATIFVGRKS